MGLLRQRTGEAQHIGAQFRDRAAQFGVPLRIGRLRPGQPFLERLGFTARDLQSPGQQITLRLERSLLVGEPARILAFAARARASLTRVFTQHLKGAGLSCSFGGEARAGALRLTGDLFLLLQPYPQVVDSLLRSLAPPCDRGEALRHGLPLLLGEIGD